MKVCMYAIYDSKTNEFLTPFFAPGDNHAKKIVAGSFGKESQLILYPSDYVLYRLGDFDTEKGLLSQDSMAEVIPLRTLIPISLRPFVLDGTFGGFGDEEEKKES